MGRTIGAKNKPKDQVDSDKKGIKKQTTDEKKALKDLKK